MALIFFKVISERWQFPDSFFKVRTGDVLDRDFRVSSFVETIEIVAPGRNNALTVTLPMRW